MVKPKIFVAGPYTGNTAQIVELNVLSAIKIGEKLWHLGATPFIPHLSHYWDQLFPHSWEEWLDYTREWLKSCDGLYFISDSLGVSLEVQLAQKTGLTIMSDMESVRVWIKDTVCCYTQYSYLDRRDLIFVIETLIKDCDRLRQELDEAKG